MILFKVDELKEWIENWFIKNRYYHPNSKTNNIPIPELYDILERMPAVDAEPIRHGRWIREPNCWYRCSECGSHYPSIADNMGYHYCPNCGAKMDEVSS